MKYGKLFTPLTSRRYMPAAFSLSQMPTTATPPATKKRAPNTKPRPDKGQKHATGAGRPVGTGKPIKPVDAALVARMKEVDTWLEANKAIVKAAGVATKAKLNSAILFAMRTGGRVLVEKEVAALEKACRIPSFGGK